MAKQWIIPLAICILILSTLCAATRAETDAIVPENIYILPDGTVIPSTAPIHRNGDTYQLMDSLFHKAIIVEKNNIVLDGRGYTMQGKSIGNGLAAINLTCSGVIVRNFQIQDWGTGILGVYDNNTIESCDFTRIYVDIAVYTSNYEINQNYLDYVRIVGSNIHIYGNEIQTADYTSAFWVSNSTNITLEANIIKFTNKTTSFISASDCNNITVFHNNFLNAAELQTSRGQFYLFGMYGVSVFPPWDNGYPSGGNYWSDYTTRYSEASARDNSGIWNTEYLVQSGYNYKLVDRYPLQNPYPIQIAAIPTSPPAGSTDSPAPSIPELPTWAIPVLFVAAASAVIILSKKRDT